MSLIIQGSPNFRDISLPKYMAENISTMLWDIDDTVYHFATGLHNQIRTLIAADANVNGDLDAMRRQWATQGKISPTGEISHRDLGWAFPLIVDHYRQNGNAELTSYISRVYDVDYSVIAPQPAFVGASLKWIEAGKRILIYSNGPWSEAGEKELHVNKVLRRIGFSSRTFVEENVIDLLKTDRNPYLPKKFGCAAAETFRKQTKEGFVRTAKTLGFTPGSHVAYFDDNWPSLAATNVLRIHVADPEAAQNRDFVIWSANRDAKGHYLSSVGLLMQQVDALMPKRKPNHKLLNPKLKNSL